MTVPYSMDNLMTNGVLNFDPNAYLNNSQPAGLGYGPNLLGNTQLQTQPQKDTFMSKAKATLNNGTFQKVATVAIVAALAFVGIKKGSSLLNSTKNSAVVQSTNKFITGAKNFITNLGTKFKK